MYDSPIFPLTFWLLSGTPALRLDVPAGRESEEEKGGPRRRGFSLFMRFLNSNRVTYEELEPHVTHTKQTIGPVPNRVFLRLSRSISSHFRTPLSRTRPCRVLIGTQNTSREFSSCRKHMTYHFLIGAEMRLFPKSHCLAVVTCHSSLRFGHWRLSHRLAVVTRHSSLVTRNWCLVSGV